MSKYRLSNSTPFGLLSKILVLIWKISFEITHLLNVSHKLGHLSRIFAVEINKTRCYDIKRITRLAFVWRNCTFPHKALSYDYAPGDLVTEIAACCLWHTSFLGYLPYQREESFRKITTDNLKLICTAKFYKNKFS